MDRALASAIAHRWHPVAAPVSDPTVGGLLERLELRPGGRVLDLGCGTGEWLLRAVAATPGTAGVGVDTSAAVVETARTAAAHRGLTDRVTVELADATTWAPGPAREQPPTGEPTGASEPTPAATGGFDAVVCVGVSHVFGGASPTLAAARRHLTPGGRVLFGDGFWEGAPDEAALAALGASPDELTDLPGLVELIGAAGFEPGWGHVSSAEEWDDYEWSWTGALAEWSLTEAGARADDAAAEALELARAHRRAWLGGYRGRLGFLTVVLRDAAGPGPATPAGAP